MFEFEIEHMPLKPRQCKVKLSPVESHHCRIVLCLFCWFTTCVFLSAERIQVNIFFNKCIAYVIKCQSPRGIDKDVYLDTIFKFI